MLVAVSVSDGGSPEGGWEPVSVYMKRNHPRYFMQRGEAEGAESAEGNESYC